MKLSDAALTDLCARSLWAAERGYGIALASEYLALLTEEVGSGAPPMGVEVGSSAHLAILSADAYAIRQGKMTKKEAPKAKPVVSAKELPPPPVEELVAEKATEPVVEEVPAEESAEEAPAAKKSTKAKK